MAFLDSLNRIWQDWSIRGAVLFSLTMQLILISLAPFRKSSSNRIMTLFIWSAYLLADATATSAVGLIVKTQRYDDSAILRTSEDFLAFWVPFLLLHLGGPDTITAFALEDNQLWVRHLLALITQGIATGYLFLQTFSHNEFRVPTLLLFIAGIIKYMERTCSLYLASRDRFRSSMIRKPKAGGVNYSKSEQNKDKTQSTKPTPSVQASGNETKPDDSADCDPQSLSGVEGPVIAHDFLTIFKGQKMDKPQSKKPNTMDKPQSTKPNSSKKPESSGAENGNETTPTDVTADFDPKSLKDVQVVVKAHYFFKIFKGLLVDIIFSFKKRDKSRDFFKSTTPQYAFRIIEAELNFMYEVLYTKVSVVHSLLGACFRLVASSSVIVALVIFYFFIKKHGFDKIDVGVTYALLLGAVGLDGLAFLISTFSNWTLVDVFTRAYRKNKFCAAVLPVYKSLLDFKKPRKYVCKCEGHKALVTPILFRKWSECVPCFNLVTYCLKGCPLRIHGHMSPASPRRIISLIHQAIDDFSSAIENVWRTCMSSNNKAIQFLHTRFRKVNNFLGIDEAVKYWIAFKKKFIQLVRLNEFLDELTYVSTEPLTMELWAFIFEELKEKSASIEKNKAAPKDLISARGDSVVIDKDGIKKYLGEVSYDESLLLWHIATELLYNGEKWTDAEEGNARGFSKIIADYMLYVLIWRPRMMSTIAGMAKLRYDDTCIDARQFFKKRGFRPEKVKTACKKVLDIDTDFVTSDFDAENESLSVLSKACELAKELRNLKEEKWKIVSKVWVELLSYGASHCGANAHAQQLSKGGDLITFVWLLMGHFGLLDQFQPNSSLLDAEE